MKYSNPNHIVLLNLRIEEILYRMESLAGDREISSSTKEDMKVLIEVVIRRFNR